MEPPAIAEEFEEEVPLFMVSRRDELEHGALQFVHHLTGRGHTRIRAYDIGRGALNSVRAPATILKPCKSAGLYF